MMSFQQPALEEQVLQLVAPFLAREVFRELLEHAAHDARLVVTDYAQLVVNFGPESKPQIHVHIHPGAAAVAKRAQGASYTDQSSGPTGAKAFGAKAKAISRGDVIQQQPLDIEARTQLGDILDALLGLVKKAKVGTPEARNEAVASLNTAKQRAKDPTATKSAISEALEKARGWISSALQVGMFAAKSASQVRELMEQIGHLLS
jgi:hypothetical protein